jgi:hypothetical protein
VARSPDGDQGGREWDYLSGSRRRVVYLQKAVGWAWAAFDLQREMIERFAVGGPFREIVAVAHASWASLGTLGAGWAEPASAGFWGQPTAVEQPCYCWKTSISRRVTANFALAADMARGQAALSSLIAALPNSDTS